jgi:peptide/nickel transport system permease protein
VTLYILRRLFAIALILVAVSILVFAIVNLLPGSVANLILGQFASDAEVHALEVRLGLADPLWFQYLRWAGGLVHGDLGSSLVMERPVAPVLVAALGRSAILALSALLLVALIGIGLGVGAALRHGRAFDHAVAVLGYLGISVPEFFWGIVIILLFAGYLGWLPATGYEPLEDGLGPFLAHLAAPVATLVLGYLAHVLRLTRSAMLETLRAPYVMAARARGVPERTVVIRHALRNALLPTITVLALDLGSLMGGIVVIETVFAYPGLGRLLVFSIQRHDIPIIEAAILAVAAIYALANLAADLAYAWLNPQIRYGRSVA